MPSAERPDLASADPVGAFERLFDDHATSLHRYFARRVGAVVAEDLVADTFLVALQQRSSYDPTRAAVRSWLFGIGTKLLMRHWRREERALRATARVAAGRGYSDSHEPGAADRVDARAQARQLAAALADLDPADRDVLLLTSWAEMDSNEVAEALSIPVGTVRSRLHRVRGLLRTAAPAVRVNVRDDEHA